VFLFMDSDWTDYVDPHTMIRIFLMFWLYFMLFLTDGFVFNDACREIPEYATTNQNTNRR
jgi:hypothetical protein